MPTPVPPVLREIHSLGDNPERIPRRESPYLSLGVRWARGGGVVLGEEQPEKVGREVPGSGTEQRSRGRRASASDGGSGDGARGAEAAAEPDTPPGGGSSPLALKAPRSFPRSPGTLPAAVAKGAQRSPLDRRSEKCKNSGRPQTWTL